MGAEKSVLEGGAPLDIAGRDGGASKLDSKVDGAADAQGARLVAHYRIGGMTCGSCVETIERMLRQQEGIYSVTVALLAEKAVIEYDGARWTDAKIAEEIEDIGFEAALQAELRQDAQIFKVYGMTCASCTSAVETGVCALPGVSACAVSLATEEARVEFDPSQIGLRDIVEGIENLGFDAVLSDDTNRTQLDSLSRVREVSEWWRAFLVSLSFAVPVFFISMIVPKWSFTRTILVWQPLSNLYLGDILCLCLTAPVQFGVGRRFYVTSFKALRHYSATMDVLIMLGTTASFVFSTLSMVASLFCSGQCSKPATFFETSTMLITFVTFGRYLENSAKGKTSEALSKLINLTPTTAIIYADGSAMTSERKVASELIQKGDYVKVIPGERIAADGIVVRGESSVDESMVTGEALPVSKVPGSAVIGGTVNSVGAFDFVVSRAGQETSLSQIVRLVSDAQTSKAPIQALADRVAGIFVPSVILLGAITFIFWMCVSHITQSASLPDVFHQEGVTKLMVCLKLCISVVVVACPCALGLSTPTAVMVGTGVGAQNGMLIKGGGPLEASSTIGCVMFDKTGTLTQGRLTVSGLCWHDGQVELLDLRASDDDDNIAVEETSLKPFLRTDGELGQYSVSGMTRSDVLEIISAAERKSEHPLARAIATFIDTAAGRTVDVDIRSFESVTGGGLRCTAGLHGTQHRVIVGSSKFVLSQSSALEHNADMFSKQQSSQGRTTVYVAVDGSVACILSLADQLKPEAWQCVEGLRRMGIRCGIITGDSRATAQAVAQELAIEETDVYAEMSPNGKRSIIIQMREQLSLSDPKKPGVAMVGDGINDSPALAAATLGIAVGGGTEIAMEAASIVLMRASLLDVAASLHLSRRIFRQIKLNYIWATAYNVSFVPLAMGIGLPWGFHLHPMMAGAAMTCSSISVVLSSLTLKWWRRPEWLRSSGTAAVDEINTAWPTESNAPLASAAVAAASKPFGLAFGSHSHPISQALDALLGVVVPGHRRSKAKPSSAAAQQQGYETVPMEAV